MRTARADNRMPRSGHSVERRTRPSRAIRTSQTTTATLPTEPAPQPGPRAPPPARSPLNHPTETALTTSKSCGARWTSCSVWSTVCARFDRVDGVTVSGAKKNHAHRAVDRARRRAGDVTGLPTITVIPAALFCESSLPATADSAPTSARPPRSPCPSAPRNRRPGRTRCGPPRSSALQGARTPDRRRRRQVAWQSAR